MQFSLIDLHINLENEVV